jgi:glycosyltransferase involved in cell wall biosynthesis
MRDAMRILVTYPADRLTGAGRYAANTCRDLVARKHEVMVAIHGDGPATQCFLEDSIHKPAIRRIDMPNLRRSARAAVEHAAGLLTGAMRLTRLIGEFRPDVIFAHCIFNVWSAIAARATGVPLVMLVQELPSAFPPPLYRMWDLIMGGAARQVVVTSEVMKAGLPVARSKSVIIPLGIDSATFTPEVDGSTVRAQLLKDARGPLILCVSHLMEGKGQHYLVEALPRVFAALPEARAVFVGGTNSVPKNEDYLGKLRERARSLGIEARIEFAGERADVATHFAAADVVVYPSRSESFGLVPVEAAAVGRPVVSNDVGIARKLAAERPGIAVVAADDAPAFAEAIIRSARLPRLQEPIGRHWTIAWCVDQLEEVLRDAVLTRTPQAQRNG